MKIYAISDTHGYLPDGCPECDLLLIGGDVCPDYGVNNQYYWLDTQFRTWLMGLPAKNIVLIAGNHDFVFQETEVIMRLNLPVQYLLDSSAVFDGIKVYGTPWVPNLPMWAFYKSDEELREVYRDIPGDTDILLTHGPPFKYGDLTDEFHGNQHVGCWAINDLLDDTPIPTVICGHIHEARGLYHYHNGTEIYNVAALKPFNLGRGLHRDPWVEITLSS